MKITGTNRDSECMYCGSKSYGKACPYGPQKLHVHIDDPRRCVWCGSTSHGAACPYNPFGKIHQRGIAYNPVMIESVQNGIIQGIVMNKLSQPITETQAYKFGLIDGDGNVVREAETVEERKTITGVDKYLIKIRNMLHEKLDILNLTCYYENNTVDTIDDIEKLYPIELQCKDAIGECVSKLHSLSKEYSEQGISSVKFEQLIIEAMLNEQGS